MKSIKFINKINEIDSTNVLRIPMRHIIIHKDEDIDLFQLYEKYESLVNEYKECIIPLIIDGMIEGCVIIDSLNKHDEISSNLNSYTKEEIVRDFEICASTLFNFASSSTSNYRYIKSIYDEKITSPSIKKNVLTRLRFYFGEVLSFSDFSNEVSLFMEIFFESSFNEDRRKFFCYLDDFIKKLK